MEQFLLCNEEKEGAMVKVVLIVIGLLFASPFSVPADMVDVVTIKLNDGCDVAQLLQVHKDLNAYGEKNGGVPYDLLTPLHSDTQGVFFAVGRHPSVEAFGKSNDDFRAKAGVKGSAAATLLTRFSECAHIVTRASAVTVQ